jgi:hypothetical protein
MDTDMTTETDKKFWDYATFVSDLVKTEETNQRFIDCIDALEIIQDDLLREAGGNCCFCGVHSSEHGFDCATIKL